jgi:hypothetical protein
VSYETAESSKKTRPKTSRKKYSKRPKKLLPSGTNCINIHLCFSSGMLSGKPSFDAYFMVVSGDRRFAGYFYLKTVGNGFAQKFKEKGW